VRLNRSSKPNANGSAILHGSDAPTLPLAGSTKTTVKQRNRTGIVQD
jgi:hypothetical protein